YALGPRLKTALLTLERRVPLLVGCVTTRIVCRRGCAHEQRIGEARRVVFASVGDARSVGYRPCRTCRPAAWARGPPEPVIGSAPCRTSRELCWRSGSSSWRPAPP